MELIAKLLEAEVSPLDALLPPLRILEGFLGGFLIMTNTTNIRFLLVLMELNDVLLTMQNTYDGKGRTIKSEPRGCSLFVGKWAYLIL
eukprot:15350968-Ditylum_brightwellii.AAC.1